MAPRRSLTYADYLRLPELLALQRPRSAGPEHDETLFIVVHQVYELWFKQILHETDHLLVLLDADARTAALATLSRILRILKTLVAQIDVLETMTPTEFLSFRDRLESASGFESFQFREVEFVLGRKDPRVLERYAEGGTARRNLARRLASPTLWDAFLRHLHRGGHPVPVVALDRDVALAVAPCPALHPMLVAIYHHDAAAAGLCERLVDLDEGITEWRYRHLRMVARTIGTRGGTGGSTGAEYLATTLVPLFPDLWAIRAEL